MRQPVIHNYIGSLQRQIADTAARIKQKQTEKYSFSENGNYHNFHVSWVEDQAYKLVGSEVSYALLGQEASIDSSYAAISYDYVSRVNKKPTVVEGLVFKNNQEFDFKV